MTKLTNVLCHLQPHIEIINNSILEQIFKAPYKQMEKLVVRKIEFVFSSVLNKVREKRKWIDYVSNVTKI